MLFCVVNVFCVVVMVLFLGSFRVLFLFSFLCSEVKNCSLIVRFMLVVL